MRLKSFLVSAILVVAVLCFSPLGALASSLTSAQVQAIVSLLQSFGADATTIANVQSSLTVGSATTSPTAWCHTFTKYTVSGATDTTTNGEVSNLQTALTREGFNFTGDSQGTFGDSTAAALVQFQGKYGITQTGTVGPKTRKKLNALYGCGTTPNPTPTPAPAPVTCTPNWTCSWGQCVNGSQSETAVDTNNCGVSSTIACPALAQACNVPISSANNPITVTVDPSFSSQTSISGGASNAVIGRFDIASSATESVKITSLVVVPKLINTTPAANGLNNVGLYFNGAQVSSQQNYTGSSLTFQLGSQIVVMPGQTDVLEVHADMQSNNSNPYTSGTVSVSLPIGVSNAQGMTSYNTFSVPSSAVSTNGLATQTGGLTVSQNPSLASQSISPNQSMVRIGSYLIKNQNTSESMRLSTFNIGFNTSDARDFSALQTSDSTGVNSTPVQPQAGTNNAFSVNETLAPGASITLDIYANTGSDNSTSVTTTLSVSSIGAVDNLATTSQAVTGQTMTLMGTANTATLSTPVLASWGNYTGGLPSSNIVVVGSSGVAQAAQGIYNFVGSGGSGTISGSPTITELKFTVTDSVNGNTVTNICLGGSNCVRPVNGVADFRGLNFLIPNSAAGINLTASISYAGVGAGLTVQSGTTSQIALTYVGYQTGGTMSSISPDVTTPTMTLMGTAQ